MIKFRALVSSIFGTSFLLTTVLAEFLASVCNHLTKVPHGNNECDLNSDWTGAQLKTLPESRDDEFVERSALQSPSTRAKLSDYCYLSPAVRTFVSTQLTPPRTVIASSTNPCCGRVYPSAALQHPTTLIIKYHRRQQLPRITPS